MLILGIEASNGKCSVSLSLKDQIIYSIYNSENSKQAEYLVVMAQEVMKKSGYNFEDIDYIATSIGPGSFTGIRIAISAAKGFGIALGKKVIGVSNFETIFYRIDRQVKNSANKIAIINAYRDELYVCKQGSEPQLIHKNALVIEEGSVVAGSGALEALSFSNIEILPRFPVPDSRFICKVAYEKILSNDLTEAVPLYIRPPDAKLVRW
jgi:tRNA threonylcarbamoyladenosine biosynthesis protein TsaB